MSGFNIRRKDSDKPRESNLFLRKNAHPSPRWRWAIPLRLRPLRMTDLSAGECLVGSLSAPRPRTAGCCGHSRSALRFAASSTVHHLRFKAVC